MVVKPYLRVSPHRVASCEAIGRIPCGVASMHNDGTASRSIRRTQAAGVGISALFSAAVSYIVLLFAAHALPRADNAIFLTYWALLFGLFGVITGLNPEAARASFATNASSGPQCQRVVPLAIGFAGIACSMLGLSGFFWASRVLNEDHAWLLAVVALAGVAFSGQLAVTGVLAGKGKWNGLILATVCEASVRLVCVLIAIVVSGSLASIAVASAVSAAGWVLLLGRRDVRAALRARGDVPVRIQAGRFLHACSASAASAALVVGFPVLIRLTTDSAEFLGAAGLLLAITLTRAPLMVPLNAYQSVALTHFLRHRHEGAQALYPVAGAVLFVTVMAAGIAGVFGPFLFNLLLGNRYAAGSYLLAGLTIGAGLLALLTLTGALCLAVGSHRGYAAGWVSATSVAVILLSVPVDLELRTVLSLVVAPIFGCLVHTWWFRRPVRPETQSPGMRRDLL